MTNFTLFASLQIMCGSFAVFSLSVIVRNARESMVVVSLYEISQMKSRDRTHPYSELSSRTSASCTDSSGSGNIQRYR